MSEVFRKPEGSQLVHKSGRKQQAGRDKSRGQAEPLWNIPEIKKKSGKSDCMLTG